MPQPYILLIDDDPDDLQFFSEAMLLHKETGLQTFDTAEKGIWFLAHLSHTSEMPGLIILDMNMPRINGSDLLSIIKNTEHTKHIPVIMYSTNCSDDLRETLIAKGALNCYTKASNVKDYHEQVRTFVALAGAFGSPAFCRSKICSLSKAAE